MPKKKRRPVLRNSVLVVVEGETDQAFCLYLKAKLSYRRNLHITVENAHGGSPDRIVEKARNLHRNAPADRTIVLFDADKDLTPEGWKMAHSFDAEIIPLHPCIEGFFLKLLSQPVPPSSKECKKIFWKKFLSENDALEKSSYEKIFPPQQFKALSQDPIFDRLRRVFFNEKEET